jgi:hypothetical protein
MRMNMKRPTARISLARGRKRSIPPDRARDEDLHVFLKVSRASWKSIGKEIDELIRPA